MSESNVRRLVYALLRAWWILGAVALIAGATAYLVADPGDPMWVGEATMRIDNATVSRYPGLPVPERVLSVVQSADFKDAVLQEAGADEGSLSFYTTGNPQTGFHARYIGPSEETAGTVADVAAEAVVARYLEMSESELSRTRLRVAEERDMVSVLEAALEDPELTSTQRVDTRYRLYSVRTTLIVDEALLQQQEGAFAYDGEPVVKQQDVESERRRTALGAALAGLALAALVVLVRERPRAIPHEG
ncbi:MAG TPA: hypothetical protein ENN10_05035 [Actinobacteria bacterium]|nr:hypothetical protein [Actinomycetota bacterium]